MQSKPLAFGLKLFPEFARCQVRQAMQGGGYQGGRGPSSLASGTAILAMPSLRVPIKEVYRIMTRLQSTSGGGGSEGGFRAESRDQLWKFSPERTCSHSCLGAATDHD